MNEIELDEGIERKADPEDHRKSYADETWEIRKAEAGHFNWTVLLPFEMDQTVHCCWPSAQYTLPSSVRAACLNTLSACPL